MSYLCLVALKNIKKATLGIAQKLSAEIQNDIAEYALYATRQMGVISAGLVRKQGERTDIEPLPHHGRGCEQPTQPISKTQALAEAGIDIRRANEADAHVPAAILDKIHPISLQATSIILTLKRV